MNQDYQGVAFAPILKKWTSENHEILVAFFKSEIFNSFVQPFHEAIESVF